jgi:hypothetical protein
VPAKSKPTKSEPSAIDQFKNTPEFEKLDQQVKAGKVTPERYKVIMAAMMDLKENVKVFKKYLRKLEK